MQSCGDYQRHHRYQRHLLHHRTFTFLFSRSQNDLQDRVLTQVPKIKVATWRWSVVTTSFRNSYALGTLFSIAVTYVTLISPTMQVNVGMRTTKRPMHVSTVPCDGWRIPRKPGTGLYYIACRNVSCSINRDCAGPE